MLIVGVFGEGASSVSLRQPDVWPANLRLVGEGMLEAAAGDEAARLVSPSLLLGLVGVGDDGCREAKKFLTKWERNIGGVPPPILEVEAEDAAAAASNWVSERLMQRLATVVADNQALRRQLAAIRLDYEMLQRSAHRLESYITGLGAAPFSSVYTCPYARATHLLTPERAVVRQTMPVAPFGLAGFDLYVELRRSDPVALFTIALRGRETGRTFGTWTISAGELQDGWTTFVLAAGIDIDADTLEVGVELQAGQTLALGLGPAHPIAECSARVEGQSERLNRPLAMRMWQGLPSVPPPALAGVKPAAGAGIRRFRLPTKSIASAMPIGSDGKPTSVRDCVRVDEDGTVWVQPMSDGAAIILIENACPRTARRVWATFASASDAIESVQVAVSALKTNGRAQPVANAEIGRLCWTDLLSNRQETLVADLGDPDADGAANSVLLGVRVDDPAKSWFAATRLVSVEIECKTEQSNDVAPERRL